VALGALHIGNRRVLVKGLKTCRRIRAYKKVHLLLAAFPHQYEGVQSGLGFQGGVEDIRERLFAPDEGAIQLEFSRGCSGNDIDLVAPVR
jgi:hypothetical protein